jgi:hypothetical protein
VLHEKGADCRESSKGRDVVALPCDAAVQCLAAGRVIVRDEEGRLVPSASHRSFAAVKTTKAFRRADGQTQRTVENGPLQRCVNQRL